MTKPYESGVLFRSSKFLVFANRFLALFAAWCGLLVTGEPVARSAKGTPLYKFSFSSVSNILSSVCQYEALKFVSFPTQVRSSNNAHNRLTTTTHAHAHILHPSSANSPRQVVQDGSRDAHGYVVNKKTYSAFEYLVAIGVTAGAAVFKLYETNDAPVKNTEFVGIILIVGYMGSDSFTSNWQSSVFKQSYKVSSMAMMMYAPRTPFPSLTSNSTRSLSLSLSLTLFSLLPFSCMQVRQPFSSAFTALGLLVTLRDCRRPRVLRAQPFHLTAHVLDGGMQRRRPIIHLSHHQTLRPVSLRHDTDGPAVPLRRVIRSSSSRTR